jgi:hypothetical protein
MPYALRDVGLECFTLVFRGEDIGAVFSTDDDHPRPWVASLYERSSQLPAPFQALSHRFGSLLELQDWLGVLVAGEPLEAA